MARWSFDDIPDQSGRLAVVTGANTGIGYETARMLALKGARVVLACRSEAKGKDAIGRLQSEDPAGEVELKLLDLSDLDSVAAFADSLGSEVDGIDLLILNAGVMVPPESRTAQGFELQFGVNHLGHFALTGRLLPLLDAREGARVVIVSSTAAQMGSMDFDDLNYASRRYQPWPAYGQSKLANQLFLIELQRRLEAAGSSTIATAAHPGWTRTDLQRTSGMASFLNPFFGMKPPQGALPTLRAATDPGSQPASYYGPHGMMQMRGYPVVVPLVKQAVPEDALRLWQASEELTGVSYLSG